MSVRDDAEMTATIDGLVAAYESNRSRITLFTNQLRLLADDPELSKYIHSMKSRTKDPDHLRDKLVRMWRECAEAGTPFDITPDNMFSQINDLSGLRILHLYTRQAEHIHRHLTAWLDFNLYDVLDCFARTWDDETREFYESIRIRTEPSPKMYTSIHFVVRANSRSPVTAEIQVRTLAEEIWGEVDHTINYPYPSPKLACREQIRVLARVSSSCSRLVDAIFTTHEEGGPSGTTVNEAPSPI